MINKQKTKKLLNISLSKNHKFVKQNILKYIIILILWTSSVLFQSILTYIVFINCQAGTQKWSQICD